MKTETDDELPDEKEALAAGLILVKAEWNGESDFDKGMRLLQKQLGIKTKSNPTRRLKG